MTEPWNTISLAASIAIFTAAGLARWRQWITSRTCALLLGASCAISTARAAAHGWWPLTAIGAVVVGLMVTVWASPERNSKEGSEQR
ncbi:hypothetical protein ACIQCF_07425 [Streptomyces sp. NPDC088353]|uniref:hypothetical protein n=1 Tax=Streptomyces sp. NPDC088353 TaxID=3365855 RepID=UPI0038153730